MSYLKLLPFVFVILLFTACTNDDTCDTPTDIVLNEKSAAIVDSDNQFGLELFQKVNAAETGNENLMISPLSVSVALAMAYNGAEGTTREQMEDMLHKSGLTPDEINQSYQTLVNAHESHDVKVDFDIANGIFYHKDYTILSDFLNVNEEYYNAEVKPLDFGDSQNALKAINGWVKDKTNDKIESILTEISTDDVMVLLNAIYFNGKWTYRFNEDDTADRVFFYEDGSSANVPTMVINEEFNYYRNENFEMLEMPYGSGKYSMLIFLPGDNITANQMAGMLSPENLDNWTGQMGEQTKKVFLPKFEFKYKTTLNTELQALGMVDAFNPEKADFKGICEDQQIFISEVIHKSYIKVNEKGTEAAAVTSVTIAATSTLDGNTFTVDHPFIFVIKEKDTDTILFIGKVTDPAED